MHKNAQSELPATTHGYFMAKPAHLDDAFSEFCDLETGPAKEIRKGEKGKADKKLEKALRCNRFFAQKL